MPEIGASLREARMRAKLDITEVEADTKIRGKYLRALENEEWSLLPGSTFVRSFLRTYGDYLGLDGRMLVEEFKLRHEGSDPRDLPPLGTPRSASASRARRSGGRGRTPAAEGRGRILLVAALVALLVVGLFVLGQCGTDGTPQNAVAPRKIGPVAVGATGASLRIVARGPIYACLRAPDGKRLIDGVVQTTTTPSRTYQGTTLRLTVGSGAATLIVNGRPLKLVPAKAARGYLVTHAGLRRVGAAQRVSCA